MADLLSKRKTRRYLIYVYVIYLVVLFALCVTGALWYPQNNTFERGACIYFPKSNATLGEEFEITGCAYALEGFSKAEIVLLDGKSEYITPIDFEKIYDKDKLLMALSTFKTDVKAPHNGEFKVYVRLTQYDGVTDMFAGRTITIDNSAATRPFRLMSPEHIIAMLVLAAIMTVALYAATRKKKASVYHIIAIITCAMIAFCDIAIRSWLVLSGTFRASYDMALHMCDISGILMPVLLFSRPGKFKDSLYNLMFIWGIGGAAMAILTPEMGGYNFPSYYFFNFFLKHGAIVFGVLLITFMKDMRPRIKKLPLILLVSNLMIAAIYGVNQLIRFVPPFDVGNYLFISYPPTGGSAIDIMVNIFGPSPWYIIGMNILGVIVFVALWAPFAISKALKRKSVEIERKAA